MFYQALATDYDGTIANEGQVDIAIYSALKLWPQEGRKLILVTGRALIQVKQVVAMVPMQQNRIHLICLQRV